MSIPAIQPMGLSRQTVYRRLAGFCAMLAIAMVFRADSLTEWDSWDYAAQAIQGHSSDLLLGRWWFIAVMRCAYLLGKVAWGLDLSNAYLAMQVASACMMAGAMVALMAWTYRLTGSVAAEIFAAALALTGPMIGIYASSVMTESLTVLMLGLAFWAWEVARARPAQPIEGSPRALLSRDMVTFLAGCAFGVAIDVREPAALFCAWPVLSCLVDRPEQRWRLLTIAILGTFVTLGLGVLGGWAWYPWYTGYFNNMRRWTHSMAQERLLFEVTPWQNAKWLCQFAMFAAPAAFMLLLPAIAANLVRAVRTPGGVGWRLTWLTLAGLPHLLSLLANHDTPVNPRFVLPMLWFLIPVAAGGVAAMVAFAGKWERLRVGAAVTALMIWGLWMLEARWPSIVQYHFGNANSMAAAYRGLTDDDVPDHALVICGPATPVALHLNRLRVRNFWIIRSGWDWPRGELAPMIHSALADGVPTYVNLDETAWCRTTRKNIEWEEVRKCLASCQVSGNMPIVRVRLTPTTAPVSAPGSP